MRVFIGLGSNLADPVEQVTTAVKALQLLPETTVIRSSSLYASPPMGPQDQPDYTNAVVELDTMLSAHDLLDQLQAIELQHGRERKRYWGERTLDLDLLIYDDRIIDDDRLQVPHPGIPVRSFVLYPLHEIASDLTIPSMGDIEQLCTQCPLDGLRRIEK